MSFEGAVGREGSAKEQRRREDGAHQMGNKIDESFVVKEGLKREHQRERDGQEGGRDGGESVNVGVAGVPDTV